MRSAGYAGGICTACSKGHCMRTPSSMSCWRSASGTHCKVTAILRSERCCKLPNLHVDVVDGVDGVA
eukprot:2250559-Amphidinium_carterae.1